MSYDKQVKLNKLSVNEQIEFNAFVKEMKRVLDNKVEEKKSWIKCEQMEILISLVKQSNKLLDACLDIDGQNPEIRKRCIHLANFCMMLWSLSSD